MKHTNILLSLLFAIILMTDSIAMDGRDMDRQAQAYRQDCLFTPRTYNDPEDTPAAYKRLRFVRELYEAGKPIDFCLQYIRDTDCSDDEAPEMDEDRLEKALWIFLLDPTPKGMDDMRRICELNLVSTSLNIELPYRIQSITLPLYSGCADEVWVQHYLPILNAFWRDYHLPSFRRQLAGNKIKESFEAIPEEDKGEIDKYMSTTMSIVALNCLYGEKEEALRLWRGRPSAEGNGDLALLERYNSADPAIFLEDWKVAHMAQVLGDIDRARATRNKQETPILAPEIGRRGSVQLTSEDVIASIFGKEEK